MSEFGGFKLIEMLKGYNIETPVLFITGYSGLRESNLSIDLTIKENG